jgi:hypothetical protein
MTYELYMADMSSEPAKTWQDDAICVKADPFIFSIVDEDHPHAKDSLGEDLDLPSRILKTVDNFEEAKLWCEICPVIDECWQNATLDDRAFTYRGGRAPSKFSGKLPGRPKGYSPNDLSYVKERRCLNGHVKEPDWVKCRTCINVRAAAKTNAAKDRRAVG